MAPSTTPRQTPIFSTRIRRWILASPPMEWAAQSLQQLAINALKTGPIPQHVGLVMDGNRRFARLRQIETAEGHNMGFEALAKILEVCYKSGVKVVTVYAFSIENFKRSKYEVDALMDIFKTKLQQVSQHGNLLDRYGACIRVLGHRSLCPPDVLEVMNNVEEMTKHNTKAILNVCLSYTGRDEITTAVQEVVNLTSLLPEHAHSAPPSSPPLSSSDDESASTSTLVMDRAHLQPAWHTPGEPITDVESITQDTLDQHMFTAGNPPLDLLIRTSGVERLSDFMLWQCHRDTQIEFVDCLWPEFDMWKFLPILLDWGLKKKRKDKEALESEREELRRAAAAVPVEKKDE